MRNPYTPIFANVLQSRLWTMPPSTRCVWLWMQLRADPEGFVCTDTAGVAVGAMVTIEAAREALSELGEASEDADPDDPHQGRLIERVPKGFRVLGFEGRRDLAQNEARKARMRRYMRMVRAREKGAQLPAEPANDTAVSAVSESVSAPKPKPKPKPVVLSEENNNPPTPQGSAVVVSARIDKLPEDWAPSDELRAEATMAGVTDLDARIADLRLGPIGGSRGVFPDKVDGYIRKQFPRWKAWGEAERAKQRAFAAAAASKPGGRGPWVPPAPEPKAKHKRVAERWGIPLEPILRDLAERKIVETLGTDAWHEHLERAIAKQAAAIRDGRAA